uniref:Uncharacterized protein n=1 Tax=Rhizophora mucronata TaxID=61149 RepID=A0A2P2N3P3_RHIMU
MTASEQKEWTFSFLFLFPSPVGSIFHLLDSFLLSSCVSMLPILCFAFLKFQ